MQLWIFGIVCLAALQFHLPPVEANSVASAFASNPGNLRSLRSDQQPNAKFGAKIRDWFRKLKNRILGRKDVSTTPAPQEAVPQRMSDLDSEDVRVMEENSGGFYVDLSKVSFDPVKDWGFRLGKWYFIRKVSASSVDWSTARVPDWVGVNGERDVEDTAGQTVKSVDYSTTTPRSNRETSPSGVAVSRYSTPGAPAPSSISNTAFAESTPATMIKRVGTSTEAATRTPNPKNNETHKRRDQSAEVMGPPE